MTSNRDLGEKVLLKTPGETKGRFHTLTKTSSLFYYCALISSWDDRSWFFLVGIYLVALNPSDLILTAIFGMLSSGLVLLLGSYVGSWIDRTPRLLASYIVLAVRNISTFICSVVLCLVFFYYDEVVLSDDHPTLLLLAKVGLVTFGVAAHLAGLTNDSMLSKDWVAILCDGNSQQLSRMTSRFRLIDLMSKVLAPMIIGQIMAFTSKAVAAIVFSCQVLVTLALFCVLLKITYSRVPRLHYRDDGASDTLAFENRHTRNKDVTQEETAMGLSDQCWSLIGGWKAYFRQKIRLAGLGLAILYMTVLGFDTVTIGYALSQGMSEFVLSLFNAGAAITGIIGALLFPYVLKCSNLIVTGLIATFIQLLGLSPCIISVWVPKLTFNVNETSPLVVSQLKTFGLENQSLYTNFTISNFTNIVIPFNEFSSTVPWSLYLLMVGIVASRVGLWMFDLAVSQLLIETVQEVDRGKVNGVQNSLNMLFDMVKFALVLCLPYPYQFGILILVSVAAVATGSIFYTTFAVTNKCRISSLLCPGNSGTSLTEDIF